MKAEHANWRRVLRRMPLPASPRAADAFWRDFDARRGLHPQHAPAAPVRLLALFLQPALAAACAAVLLAAGLLLARGWGAPGGQAYAATHGRYASMPADDAAPANLPGTSGMELNEEEGGT